MRFEAATAALAPALAAELLGGVDSRLAHSLAVGRRAEQLTAGWPAAHRHVIAAAAYLHDIGYSPQCVDTTWHPLDGARWLARHGWAPAICRLVLWHTAAWHEGRLRGLYAAAADEFGPPALTDPAAAALTAADLTTGPAGEPLSVDDRIADIRRRYPAGSLVICALDLAEADMRNLVDQASRSSA